MSTFLTLFMQIFSEKHKLESSLFVLRALAFVISPTPYPRRDSRHISKSTSRQVFDITAFSMENNSSPSSLCLYKCLQQLILESAAGSNKTIFSPRKVGILFCKLETFTPSPIQFEIACEKNIYIYYFIKGTL